MTELAAIRRLNLIKTWSCSKDSVSALEEAIVALEEIQQYRAIGTVEEIRRMQKYSALAKKHGTIGKVIESCAEYEEIGTVEECREAVEKQIPVKMIPKECEVAPEWSEYDCKCPACCREWKTYLEFGYEKYCFSCGQALEWST